MESYRVAVHFFQGYWEDIGTIHSFYRANVALAKEGQFALYDPDFPLYTHPRYLSPTRIHEAQVAEVRARKRHHLGRNLQLGERGRLRRSREEEHAAPVGPGRALLVARVGRGRRQRQGRQRGERRPHDCACLRNTKR